MAAVPPEGRAMGLDFAAQRSGLAGGVAMGSDLAAAEALGPDPGKGNAMVEPMESGCGCPSFAHVEASSKVAAAGNASGAAGDALSGFLRVSEKAEARGELEDEHRSMMEGVMFLTSLLLNGGSTFSTKETPEDDSEEELEEHKSMISMPGPCASVTLMAC